MIPILYAEDEELFTTNGLGRLTDCLSCKVTEELNGEYTCDFEYPYSGRRFADIQVGRIVLVEVPDGSRQPFRINSLERTIDGTVTAKTRHISYDLAKRTVWRIPGQDDQPFTFTPSDVWDLFTGSVVWHDVDTPYTLPYLDDFTFYTDIIDTIQRIDINHGYDFHARSIRDILGGGNVNFTTLFEKGEFEWDGKTVKFLEHRGTDRNVYIRYGKNMTELNAVERYDTYDAILPYADSGRGRRKTQNQGRTIGEQRTGWEACIYRGNLADVKRLVPIDFTEIVGINPTNLALRTAAQKWFESTEPWNPVREISVSFAMPTDNTNALSRVLLGDTVHVSYAELGIDGTLRVNKYTYNVLSGRYDSLNLSHVVSTLINDLVDLKETIKAQLGSVISSASSIADGTYEDDSSIDGGFIYGRQINGASIVNSTISSSTFQNLDGSSLSLTGNMRITNGKIEITGDNAEITINGERVVTEPIQNQSPLEP